MTGSELITALRNGGLRVTLARRAICNVLADSQNDHLTAPEIHERVRAATGGIDRSTVHRTLNELEELGLIHHVHLNHKPGVYHLTTDQNHHHLVCEHCGDTTSVPLSAIEGALDSIRDEYGFVANGLHFGIVGECSSCHSSQQSP